MVHLSAFVGLRGGRTVHEVRDCRGRGQMPFIFVSQKDRILWLFFAGVFRSAQLRRVVFALLLGPFQVFWIVVAHFFSVKVLVIAFIIMSVVTATVTMALEGSSSPSLKVSASSKLYKTVMDWIPLVGILVVHLVLGLCVDRFKGGKSLAIEEILAR